MRHILSIGLTDRSSNQARLKRVSQTGFDSSAGSPSAAHVQKIKDKKDAPGALFAPVPGEGTLAQPGPLSLETSPAWKMLCGVRATVVGISFLAVVALVPAGFVFGLNGEQWSWWRAVSWVGALSFVVTAAAFPRDGNAPAHPRLRALAPAGFLSGLAVIAISLATMAARYSDPYGGPLLWPHVLALFALAGLVVIELSLFALAGRSVGSVGRHS